MHVHDYDRRYRRAFQLTGPPYIRMVTGGTWLLVEGPDGVVRKLRVARDPDFLSSERWGLEIQGFATPAEGRVSGGKLTHLWFFSPRAMKYVVLGLA